MTAATTSTYEMSGRYPIEVDIGPAQPQNRLSVLLRIIFAIPHYLIVAILGYVVAVTSFIAWLIVVITGRCPGGLFRFHAGWLRWQVRAAGYIFLLTDRYPPFAMADDTAYPIRMQVAEALENRNRLTAFFRIILAIPHLIIVTVLIYAAAVVLVISWVAALITGSVPAGLHNFMAGTLRWYGRLYAYVYLLTDEYPPFSLN